ncbi:hypothetical protein KSS87_007703 [Heliosperma pusillum]|nr:hypothetical protein KSS87_007703 [Heliosperma pusillum]
MSLLLTSQHLSLPFKTPFHHRNPHPHLFNTTLLPTLYPNRTSTYHPHIYAAAAGHSETLPNSAIQRIADKLRSLGFVEDSQLPGNDVDSKIGEVFVPSSRQIPIYRVGHTIDSSWSTPNNPVPEPGSGKAVVKLNQLKRVAKFERMVERDNVKKAAEEVPSLAELTLEASELRRLRTLGIRIKQKMKIGKAGITEGIVNGIHERWRTSEVVKIICDDISKLNMKRTHDLLERKTGGMVVWRAGSKIVLYRGVNYKFPYFSLDETSIEGTSKNEMNFDGMAGMVVNHSSEGKKAESSGPISEVSMPGQSSLIPGVGAPSRVRLQLPGERQLVEEADRLLDGLGPRFTDWWGCEPLPIDADLLPAVVPGFRRPFRLLPYGVKPKLTNDEMTILKRLGRPLPCHFALGRNRKHQGLAEAILKLWEKCEIAKIAIKRGVQNTNSELMAEELKSLTSGVLLSRDKEFIVFYRGKDFLPAVVSSAIQERRKSRIHEEVQLGGNVLPTIKENKTLNSEGYASVSASETSTNQKVDLGLHERKTQSIEAAITKTNKKLSMVIDEKARSEKLLMELEEAEISRQSEIDKEGITEEERYMLRKVGLKMKPFLLLGRRGVFDGTIENMHLHWKYRELVKIICGGWNIDEIHKVARTLEAESGGILVAVEKDRKGHAIIVYRGKNYQRPASLRPQTLLNKKKALKRSIEAQRRQSLKLSVLKLSKNIQDLKHKLCILFYVKGVEEPELNSVVSDANADCHNSSNPSIQDKISSLPHVPEKSLILSGVTDQKEQTSTIINPSIAVEPEASSEIFLPASSDSGKLSCDGSLFNSAHDDSDLPITAAEVDISRYITFKDETINPAEEENFKVLSPPTLDKTTESNSHALPVRARVLTNKERLLLRKEALKMKRRPVLAVGRSNVITGVAKAIKDHFKKYPLAIVNIKGRAKGTSVKEVIFMLEQETGGLLVSQEPSKVILYRGWGAGVEKGSFGSSSEDNSIRARKPSLAVSPELMAAMRLECGLSSG